MEETQNSKDANNSAKSSGSGAYGTVHLGRGQLKVILASPGCGQKNRVRAKRGKMLGFGERFGKC